MKTGMLSLTLCALLAVPVFAQDSTSVPRNQIGVLISGNVTRNIVDYHVSGPDRKYSFGSTFGLAADIPLGQTTAVVAGLGYYTVSFTDRNKWIDVTPPGGEDRDIEVPGGKQLQTEGSFNFLALQAMFRIEYFCVGFNFGLPLTAKITNTVDGNPPPAVFPHSSGDTYTVKGDISPASGRRNFLVEARVAGDFPLIESASGSLHLGIAASYPLTNLLTISDADRASDISNGMLPVLYDNFRLPSMSLSVSYLFPL